MSIMNVSSQWYRKEKSISYKPMRIQPTIYEPLSLEKAVALVLRRYPDRCEQYHKAKNGGERSKEFGFLIGMTFKKLKGYAKKAALKTALRQQLKLKAGYKEERN